MSKVYYSFPIISVQQGATSNFGNENLKLLKLSLQIFGLNMAEFKTYILYLKFYLNSEQNYLVEEVIYQFNDFATKKWQISSLVVYHEKVSSNTVSL